MLAVDVDSCVLLLVIDRFLWRILARGQTVIGPRSFSSQPFVRTVGLVSIPSFAVL
jgi:hypothetical protein